MDNTEEKYFLTRGKAILAGLVLIIIVTIVIVINVKGKASLQAYTDFENELKTAAENYYIIEDMELDDGEEKRIYMNELKRRNLIYNELSDKCSGYVIIVSEKNISTDEYDINYRPYIKCSNKYMTSNYSEY